MPTEWYYVSGASSPDRNTREYHFIQHTHARTHTHTYRKKKLLGNLPKQVRVTNKCK